MRRIILCGCAVLSIAANCFFPGNSGVRAATIPAANVVGYMSYYTYDRLSSMSLEKLTSLVWQGVKVSGPDNPTLVVGDASYSLSQLTGVAAAGHSQGIKVLASMMGPWTGGASDFNTVISSNTLRPLLVANLKDLTIKYGLDGIEVDSENRPPVDVYSQFMKDLYDALHPMGKMVVISAEAYRVEITPYAASLLDFISLMTYDMYKGAGYPYHSTYDESVQWIEFWAKSGIPRAKLVMGIPTFARDAQSLWIPYGTIVAQVNPQSSQNQATLTSFNGQTVQGGVLWWNGVDLVKQKATYVKSTGLGGVMIYELGTDLLQDPRSLLTAATDVLSSTTVLSQASVITGSASNVLANSATLNAQVTGLGNSTTVLGYFEFGPTLTYGSRSQTVTLSATGPFNVGIAALNPGQTYHFRACVSASSTVVYGSDATFVVRAASSSNASSSYSMVLNTQGQGTLSPAPGTYQIAKGTQVTLTAKPSPGWIFRTWNWPGNSSNTLWTDNPASWAMIEPVSLTAVFEQQASPVTKTLLLNKIGDKTATVGEQLAFVISGDGSDVSRLAYSASNLPAGATFNPARAQFAWTPSVPGSYPGINFRISDGSSTASETITVRVNSAIPPAPSFASPGAVSGSPPVPPQPLTVSTVAVENVERTSATVTWLTNSKTIGEITVSSVSTNETLTEASPVVEHRFEIAGLKPVTSYAVTASSKDTSGKTVESEPASFVTSGMPATFTFDDLVSSSTQGSAADGVSLSIKARNIGEVQGEVLVAPSILGPGSLSPTSVVVTLLPGAEELVSFRVKFESAGVCSVTYAGLSTSIEVISAVQPVAPSVTGPAHESVYPKVTKTEVSKPSVKAADNAKAPAAGVEHSSVSVSLPPLLCSSASLLVGIIAKTTQRRRGRGPKSRAKEKTLVNGEKASAMPENIASSNGNQQSMETHRVELKEQYYETILRQRISGGR